MNATIEFKASGVATVAAGAAGQGSGNLIKGYMTIFNVPDLVGDITKPGAFLETIQANPHPPLLWSHDTALPPVGVIRHWSEVTDGVFFVAQLAGTKMGEELAELVRLKALTGVSYGYIVDRKGTERRQGKVYRTLERCSVMELSLCNFPAHPDARLVGEEGKDLFTIGETECLQACGVKVDRAQLVKYVDAIERQAERKMYGMTLLERKRLNAVLLKEIERSQADLAQLVGEIDPYAT